MSAIEEIHTRLIAPAELLAPGVRQPINIVDGKPELILPSDHTYFNECAEQCFFELAKTERFFRQGDIAVELMECEDPPKLEELTIEAFRSRLETHFTLRSVVMHNGQQVTKQKLCSHDHAKALLATQAAVKHLSPIRAVLRSPVFALDNSGCPTVLNRGYHNLNGGTYILTERHVDTTVEVEKAVKSLLEIVQGFSFLQEADRSRCIAGIISPALRFGRLLDADFPLDLCEADQSQSGKSYRMELISTIYGERPFVIVMPSESKSGVGSLDESLSEALLSGSPFIALDNVRGSVTSQLLESAIRGERSVSVRRAYSRTTQIDTDHVCWLLTSNRAQTTRDLANRSVITRLRKQRWDYKFLEYDGDNLLTHVKKHTDYYLSCIFAVVREWHRRGRPRTNETRHDFREWSQTLDWIIRSIFKLPPLLDDHHSEQLRISTPGLNFLREVGLAVKRSGQCDEQLSATEIASICNAASIDVPGCYPGAELDQQARRIGGLLGPVFSESELIEVEEFRVQRIHDKAYDEKRSENRPCKLYRFEIRNEKVKHENRCNVNSASRTGRTAIKNPSTRWQSAFLPRSGK